MLLKRVLESLLWSIYEDPATIRIEPSLRKMRAPTGQSDILLVVPKGVAEIKKSRGAPAGLKRRWVLYGPELTFEDEIVLTIEMVNDGICAEGCEVRGRVGGNEAVAENLDTRDGCHQSGKLLGVNLSGAEFRQRARLRVKSRKDGQTVFEQLVCQLLPDLLKPSG